MASAVLDTARSDAPTMGTFRPVSLFDRLRDLLHRRWTGVLHLQHGERRVSLRLVNGQIVSGSSGAPVRVGEVLVRCGALSPADLEHALSLAQAQGRRLGPLLREMRLVSRERLEDALRLQIRDVLLTAVRWCDGTYELEPDDAPTPLAEDVTLGLCTGKLLLEAAQTIDKPEIVREALGDLDCPVVAVEHPPVRLEGATLSPADAYVLSRVDGSMTARQILTITPLPPAEVERSLAALLLTGIVERRPHPKPRKLSPFGTPPRLTPATAELRAFLTEATAGIAQKDHYQVLGVPPTASHDEVRAAYQRLVKRLHPDVLNDPEQSDLRDSARALLQRVTEAYAALRSSASPPTGAATSPQRAETPSPTPEPPPLPPPVEMLRDAEEHLGAGRLWEASVALEDVLARSQGRLRQRAQLLLARTYAKSASGAKRAEVELKGVLDEDPGNMEAHLTLGQLYRQKGLAGRAESMFRQALALEPGNPRATQELDALRHAGRSPGLLGRLTARAR